MANPPDCERCGDQLSPENKNKAGHYRSMCWDCILAEAAVPADEAKRQKPPDYE